MNMKFSPSYPNVFACSDGTLLHYGVRVLKQTTRPDGYLVCRVPGLTQVLSHRIVADAFHGRSENGSAVNHLNGVRSDNRAENLEWCDQTRNCRHAVEHELRKRKYSKEIVLSLREEFHGGASAMFLSGKYSVPKMTVYAILNGYSYRDDGGPIRERRDNVYNGYVNGVSAESARSIAKRFLSGESAASLSAEFGLSKHAITGIASDIGGEGE